MSQSRSVTLAILLTLCGWEAGSAQFKPDLIKRGKSATALVEVTHEKGGAAGSAFCIDASGLFITNAHVIENNDGKEGTVRLVVDIGLETQRILSAKVLRHDDELDLALLQAVAEAGLTPLELGRDADLKDRARIVTFGYPFGKATAVGRAEYPDITVLPSRITSLHRDKGQLVAIQFDNQLNPGNSGGPVLDGSGKVIGMMAEMVPGAALNLAIPAGRLAEFLKAPGLAFNPPPLTNDDRKRPVTWTIQLLPSTPQARLPEGMSVVVAIHDDTGKPRRFTTEPAGSGAFKMTLTPLPTELAPWIQLGVQPNPPIEAFTLLSKDKEIRVGDTTLKLSEILWIWGGESPRVKAIKGRLIEGPIEGLGTVRTTDGRRTGTVELNQAQSIQFLQVRLAVDEIAIEVEAKQDTKVLATIHKQTRVTAWRDREALGGAQPDRSP